MGIEDDDHVSDEDDYYSDDNVYDDLTETINTTTTMNSFGRDKEKNYTVLSEYDLRQRQEDYMTEVSNLLCVSKAVALILLREYNWSVNKLHEAWFANEEQVRNKVGLIEKKPPIINGNTIMACKICYKRETVYDAGCGIHSFCSLCLKNYITKSIVNDGAGCLNLRCPDPSCSVPIDQDLIKKVVSAKDNLTYFRYLVRSYFEGNSNIKLCPAANCTYAVEYKYKVVSCSRSNCDVTCVCTHSFCWKCMEEAHSPVDCGTAAKWISKRREETETMNWILAKCKPCPECKEPLDSTDIKKICSAASCNRMTCKCGFVYCWLCHSRWKDTLHICQIELGADQIKRKRAKSLMDRYTDYYSRQWAANESIRECAKKNLQELQAVYMEKLKNVQGMTSSQLSFITEAWQLIIESRCVLKWTYADRYYLPGGEMKSQLSEYLQSEAESCLERLQHCAEEFNVHHHSNGYGLDFNVFCEKLSNLTNVTQDLFMKLVQELENNVHLVHEGLCGNCNKRGISLTESDQSVIGPLPKKRFFGP
ncbi:hypothetical protein AQUCO_02700070v1 [Aquilegia coerulea]|uniref:RBR-type E3 ubiquitin transferase n=1 Tax=Aquilegia coerulea TaxID=218851 RepID=A0A2G5D5W1_AQUCA|nr:hypothetical protein AQUCO_02700070v1 [Aquilegia coerulea]